MNLPAKPPGKVRLGRNFDEEKLTRLVWERGVDVSWEQCAECPCARLLDNVVKDFDYADTIGPTGTTTEPRVDCEVCEGKGYFFHSPQTIKAAISNITMQAEGHTMRGEFARGAVSISVLPENLLAYKDRITLVDSIVVRREARIHKATIDALRYPVIKETLQLNTGTKIVGVLYAHKADTGGVAHSANVLVENTDFIVTSNGRIDWTLGISNGHVPAINARFTMTYYAHPRYVIDDFPHSVRDFYSDRKSAGVATVRRLPVNALGKLEFGGEHV